AIGSIVDLLFSFSGALVIARFKRWIDRAGTGSRNTGNVAANGKGDRPLCGDTGGESAGSFQSTILYFLHDDCVGGGSFCNRDEVRHRAGSCGPVCGDRTDGVGFHLVWRDSFRRDATWAICEFGGGAEE